ncbi:DUF3558 domain-containing protein [Prauserella flavalba]|uniref:DUF3558 domain-containing protein n=1 Tax=Prauserella flavalba TaxID=1477506 RepID=UPI0036E334BA
MKALKSRPLSVAAFALVVAFAVTSCSAEEPGTPTTTTSAAVATGTSPAEGDVPQVQNPLDPAGYLDKPCDLLPSDFMHGLGYTEPGQPQEDKSLVELTGPACGWNDRGKGETVVVAVQTGNQRDGAGGLQGLYDAYKAGQFEYWEPTTVDDYPAAFSDNYDARESGSCRIVVGIADDLSFSASAGPYSDEPGQACPVAEQVAGAVIDTLKGGA